MLEKGVIEEATRCVLFKGCDSCYSRVVIDSNGIKADMEGYDCGLSHQIAWKYGGKGMNKESYEPNRSTILY
jgi:hypothetical protein